MFTPALMQINREEFNLVPEAKKSMCHLAVNISARGVVSLNERLKAEIKKHTDSYHLGFACHKDKHSILLFVTDDPNYTFPASGSRKDPSFTRSLVEIGVELPTQYIVEWNEQASCWVGVLKDGPAGASFGQNHKKARAKQKVKQ